jgi:hypothetical protein
MAYPINNILYKIKMSDPIEEVTDAVEEVTEQITVVPVKQKRVMSDKQKESLKLAREKAFLYGRQLKEEKEKLGDVKPTHPKKLNKSQIKIMELQKRNEEKEEVKEEVKEVKPIEEIKPIEEVKVVKEVNEVVKEEVKQIEEIKPIKEDATGSSSIKPKEEVKQYRYVKDENGNLFLR